MSLSYSYQLVPNTNIVSIELNGRLLSKEDAAEVTHVLEQEIEKGNNQVLLNIEKLDFMNSTGINVFISYLTKCRNSGGELVITNVSSKIEQLLVVTKLFSVFTIAENQEEGLSKLLQTQD